MTTELQPHTDRPEAAGPVLVGPHDRAVAWSPGERLHHLFDLRCALLGRRARRHLAVDYGRFGVSFADLQARSHQLAHHLVRSGVRPGTRVATLLGRSLDSYAAVLALSRLGASAVPLDASFPGDRIRFLLSDSEVRQVLTVEEYADRFDGLDIGGPDLGASGIGGTGIGGTGIEVLVLDRDRAEIHACPRRDVTAFPALASAGSPRSWGEDGAGNSPGNGADSGVDPECYVIYTSGSTGRPKGVPIRHSSIVNFLRVAVDLYGFMPHDRVYQGMTTAFDYSFEEIWVPLLAGSTLVPAPPGAQLVGDDLRDHLAEHRVTALACVPTVLATLQPGLDDLRLLLVSGEACPADVIAPWFRPGRRILNLYGPTETTVSCTWGVMEPERPVTIGRPLPTYRVVILDPDEPRVLTAGEPGEITVAGIGVAEGYLNRPDQTAAAFVDDFVGIDANPGGRLYRTGDLGRITPDGEIEYLGRIDTQVKIRGYRIELSEIETAARAVDGVANAVVMPHTPDDGGAVLAIWLTPTDPADLAALDIDRVHAELRAGLPAYMVPSFYEVLDELPLLPSGKADRKALPAPVSRHVTTGAAMVAPRNEVEAQLAELLAATLGLAAVSVEADFFDDLGADSLTLAGFVTALRSTLGVRRVTLKQLYQNPSIAALAPVIPTIPARARARDTDPTPDTGPPAPQTRPPAPPTRPPAPGVRPADADTGLPAPGTRPPAPGVLLPDVDTGLPAPGTRPPAPGILPPDADTGLPAAEAGLTGAHPATEDPGPVWPPRRVPTRAAHVGTGVAQAAVFAVTTFVAAAAGVSVYHWVGAASGWLGTYQRLVGGGVALWVGTVVALIAVKWLAVGRFDDAPIPLWSARYVRFWVARLAIELNPMVLFTGTPAYNVFLRALGMRVGPRAVVLTRPPVCTDLVWLGADSVLRHEVVVTGYEARHGWIVPGPVRVGAQVVVGDGSVLAPGTTIDDGAQLGPASGLAEGQRIPAGAIWQGSPAEPSSAQFDRCDPVPIPPGRRVAFTVGQLATLALVTLPASMVPVWLAPRVEVTTSGLVGPGLDDTLAGGLVGGLVGGALAAFVLLVLALNTAAAVTLVIPRLLNRFVVPERSHPLYGLQYQLARTIARLSNNRFLNTVFGDSAMIVGWLSAVGYDLTRSTQTGSNFGVDQQHHNPFLCRFDRNTLVSDGLRITNMEVSATSFRVRPVAVPPDTYLGNVVRYPADARVGANCLIATKAAIPVDGPIRTGVGILGSPAFEIPRTVQRDRLFDLYKQPGVLERRLDLKLRSNVVTMLAYLFRWWLLTAVGLGVAATSLALFDAGGPEAPVVAGAAALTVAAFAFTVISALLSILGERLVLGFRPLEPLYCSLYDQRFWAHERFWKLNYNAFLRVFDGTPFKPWFLRLQGAQVGARVFDDGAGLTEPSLVRIGDDCSLNYGSALQAHSLEDGTFKSDRIHLGAGVTVGTSALVHYGTVLGDGCRVDADAFVMKGSAIEAASRWQGNPARALHQLPPPPRPSSAVPSDQPIQGARP